MQTALEILQIIERWEAIEEPYKTEVASVVIESIKDVCNEEFPPTDEELHALFGHLDIPIEDEEPYHRLNV